MNKKFLAYLLIIILASEKVIFGAYKKTEPVTEETVTTQETVAPMAGPAYGPGPALGGTCGPVGNCCPPTVCNTRCYPCNPPCCRGWTPGPRWRFCCARWGWGRNKACCYPNVRCCQPPCEPAAEVVAPFDDYRYAGPAENTEYQEVEEYQE